MSPRNKRYNPIATYRLQFHNGFNFQDFKAVIPYLKDLGVSTIYASPIFRSVPGSNHGYDGTDPHEINPEIGNRDQFFNLIRILNGSGIGWLQDIVPNHMAFHPDNEWLIDVLEKGRKSIYSAFFDIWWESPVYDGKLMVPFLGDTPDRVIHNGDLRIGYTDRLVLQYGDAGFPMNRNSYVTVLSRGEDIRNQAVKKLLDELQLLHQVDDPAIYHHEWHEFLLQLNALIRDPQTGTSIMHALESVNQNPDLLKQLASSQEYQLCHWSETDTRINYRRFFTVNSLICLNVQDPNVFEKYHRFIAELLSSNVIQGVRVDHVDGLYDPGKYLEQLRDLAGEAYITVEKILEPGEKLDPEWPVDGNTGYDFLAVINNLFTRKESETDFTVYYRRLTGETRPVREQIAEKKAAILYQHMAGELENLIRLFPGATDTTAVAAEELKAAVGAFLICCPVYRFYGNEFPIKAAEKEQIRAVLTRMRAEGISESAINVLQDVILYDGHDRQYIRLALQFYQRLMQFSGPLMAKGVEDTLMYTFNRFIGHNEVGDSPETFGLSLAEFHDLMVQRQLESPFSMNASSTHDTKRGEDVRARLNVLTDIPGEWLQLVEEWREVNSPLKTNGAPDVNDEYFIYQSVLGAFPMPGQHDEAFPERIRQYLEKALREGKVHSGWTSPDEAYEKAALDFAEALLDREKPFWISFEPFYRKVADFGVLNSLAQLVLKFTCPGIPDVYQGAEHWDLSFVDPDNRRPVDFESRHNWLSEVTDQGDPRFLWRNRFDGRIKIWLTAQLFRLRKDISDLFAEGAYLPLEVEGKYKGHFCSFARRYKDQWLLVCVPLHLATVLDQADQIPDWGDTRILVPEDAPREWEDILNRKTVSGGFYLRDLLQECPLLLLRSVPVTRNAGILLSAASLPSAFGIGDMGPEAYSFADFLSEGRQRYWQLLPLNPTDSSQMHSPYSSVSAMAGNTLLISPEALIGIGLLKAGDCDPFRQAPSGITNYETARVIRQELFPRAWRNFNSGKHPGLKREYERFKRSEQDWLEDYTLFTALREQFGDSPWYEWPVEFRMRRQDALHYFAQEHADNIEMIRFLQFIFHYQWAALKKNCNQKGIEVVGDLPFYVSYDSADVWAHKELFSLDGEGRMTGIAGVPPDYFNADGQLWGMPVFRWEIHKEKNYSWWIRRLRKNLEFYDLIRLDHFRAFSAFWEVPAGSVTAKDGSWIPGPGQDFFEVVEKELGQLPFLAEDLGDIDDPVYRLRDEFRLPGMKVLQFAFGADIPESLNSPHNFTSNFFVYTGTHDNNTTAGWFRTEADEDTRVNIGRYAGIPPTEQNVHLILMRLAYGSVAKTVIIPIQDVLGLDENARMNTPAATTGNWMWALKKDQLGAIQATMLRDWVALFNR